MSFQTPVTVQGVLEGIHRKDYLLPAIQREFVWQPDQIRKLVDSLMCGYPIGSFLFWKVDAENALDAWGQQVSAHTVDEIGRWVPPRTTRVIDLE